MPYLIAKDLRKSIQAENLQQIIGNDDSTLTAAILTAVEEATSYLVQKYNLTREFQDLTLWHKANVYKATNRVYLNATAYSAQAPSYAVGALVLQAGNVYRCKTAINAPEAFNAAKWDLLGAQFDIFFAKFPFDEFDFNRQYAVGDQVWWKDKTYTCRIQTRPYSQETFLQFRELQDVPFLNVAPDNVNNGVQYWGNGVNYSVPADTDILNTAYWTKGDNRSQQLLTTVVDIALYHVHSRISPRNIPDLRVKRYDDALKWLKMANRGEITAMLPIIQPPTGNRIRYGGNVKQINSY